ncbi:MAG: hypothetical protein LUO89_04830 [Methanothrix sp.]|nr:hypothetical protein [Methanothrix sp.]
MPVATNGLSPKGTQEGVTGGADKKIPAFIIPGGGVTSFFALSAQASHARRSQTGEMVVRAVGVEPTRALQPCGFSYRLRLSPP